MLFRSVVRAAGTRVTVAAGLTLLTAGLAVLSQVHLDTSYAVPAIGLALAGLGTGMSIAAAMDQVMAAAGGDEAGAGASVNSTLRQVGGAIAVAVLGSRLPDRGSILRAGPTAFLHGMSVVMLICAAVTALAALTSLRYLPGRASSGSPGSSQPPATATSPARTRR